MENLEELAKLLLPQGILEYFDYKSYKTENKKIIITLIEKNTVPKLPAQYKNRKIRQKGFKQISVNDFPVRGKQVQLHFRRRVWQIQGVKELYKREIPDVIFPGTRLEKQFADFLKGGD